MSEDYQLTTIFLIFFPRNFWNRQHICTTPVPLQIREKERNALEERDPAISLAKRRQKMIASLPKLFNMIHFLFQSIKRSVVTKEELMHRIVANNLDIVDRREVEDHLNFCKNWLLNGFMRSWHLAGIFSYVRTQCVQDSWKRSERTINGT